MATSTDVSVRGLDKHFGRVRAVQGLTFDVPAGQVTGFLGPNGAGKTTTLRMILGLVRPSAGEALVGGYSLGMRQRLALAAALLADPQVLILDEPGNGLDPAGMAWLRALLRELAAGGRTVVVSSHLLAEVAQTVDHVVVVHEGRLRFAGPLAALAPDGTSLE